MVYEEDLQPSVDIWAFTRPLTWQLWVVFAATLVALPFIFWVMEKLNTEGYIPFSKSSSYDLRFALCEREHDEPCRFFPSCFYLTPVVPPALLQTVISWLCSRRSEAAACCARVLPLSG